MALLSPALPDVYSTLWWSRMQDEDHVEEGQSAFGIKTIPKPR